METKQQDSIQEMKNVEEVSSVLESSVSMDEFVVQSQKGYNTFELNELINLFKELLQNTLLCVLQLCQARWPNRVPTKNFLL